VISLALRDPSAIALRPLVERDAESIPIKYGGPFFLRPQRADPEWVNIATVRVSQAPLRQQVAG
jgi:hypothetical protein